ncbi:bifunctional oligoribonuclease/PAP phosphatase NrnA, partial [bacterium]|nr:bifunctional oligoribonuclease/PAP phosphatase NrnA [bacterium]
MMRMSRMHEAVQAAIRERLSTAKEVLIVAHVRPDGDAIGSLLGLGLSLKKSGRKVQMVVRDGVPDNLMHLPGSQQITTRVTEPFDTFIAVDSGDLNRLGSETTPRQPDIQIDHHITNTKFALINLVVPDAVATAAILAESLPKWGLPITKDVASSLLTGILTDTIGFRTSNMTSNAL